MKWSLRLGRFAGVDLFVHWTFAILVGLIFVLRLGEGVPAALTGVAFILALFACVVLHEFGHIFMARRYGVKTKDITLLPIGGVARLERIPKNPMQEFWVALAGPAVNVVIAILIFGLLFAIGSTGRLLDATVMEGGFLARLMWVNVFLVAFNLLPAFPMDGGRVLRALLATRLPHAQATQIAAKVGQGMAVLFAIGGFFLTPMLLFIALFVYFGAQGEAGQAQVSDAIDGLTVRHAMETRFRVLEPDDSLAIASEKLLAGAQQDFPVVQDGRVVGLLRRQDLLSGLSQFGGEARVEDVMSRTFETLQADGPLERALEKLSQSEYAALPVEAGGRLVGLLTRENIGELVMVNSALHSHAHEAGV